jgi:uncharacterized membrane protein
MANQSGLLILWVINHFLEVAPMATNKNAGKIIDIVFKSIALAMAVAVVVMNILGVMEPRGQILLLGIGLFALAITLLDA